MNSKLTHADLQNFTGDSTRYQHLNKNVIYTPGVQYLAEQAGAYWLIDAIASYFGTSQMEDAIERDERLRWLQFWRLEVGRKQTALLTARADDGEESFVSQAILWTDFPLSEIDVWAGYGGKIWTLYLPSEH